MQRCIAESALADRVVGYLQTKPHLPSFSLGHGLLHPDNEQEQSGTAAQP